MDLDINQYLDIFVEEAKEHLQSMNDILLELEKDISNKELLNELFRIAHTLKGMAGTMGFTNMADLTHVMEDVLDGIRNDEINVSTQVIDILFECFDELDYSVNSVAETGSEDSQEYTKLVAKLKTLIQGEIKNDSSASEENKEINGLNEYVLNVVKKAEEENLNSYKIYIKLDEDCMLKSARAFIIFNTLENLGEIVYSNPPVEDIEDEKFNLDFSIVVVSQYEKEDIRKELLAISEIDKIEITPIVLSEINVDAKKNLEISNDTSDGNNKKEANRKKAGKKQESNTIHRVSRVGKTVRVDIDRLDNLMNLVSELIIIKTRMEDISGTSSGENMLEAIEYLERITTNLHDAVMKVRMVPIERVFNRFPRMVRDLSKELNKEINLVMSGEETEVDRTVIDEIGDPLIHLIRNSIDHGIEQPDERIKIGKEESGTVKLTAYPDGNNVVIEVEDDGRGIEHEKVLEKAISKEIVSENDIENLSKEEIVHLLFTPGFSTSDEVSDVSGRGVGLDVVRSKIESINGSIEVNTEERLGSKFIIRIPLTLAIIQALLIKLGDEIFAIPLSSISEINNIKNSDIRDVQGQEVILYRGKTLPIVRLNRLMDIEEELEKDIATIVVVRKGDRQAGLVVDGLIGQQEIVIKPLGKYLSNVKYIAGATILGNGEISLILDVNSLF